MRRYVMGPPKTDQSGAQAPNGPPKGNGPKPRPRKRQIGKAIHKNRGGPTRVVHGKGKGKGKGGKGGKGRAYGAMGGYKGVPRKRAARLVNAEIREAVRDLRRERADVRRETRRGVNEARALRDRSYGDISHVFNESGGYIADLNNKNQAQFNQTAEQSKAAQAALMQQLHGTGQQAQTQVGGDLARLGLGSGGGSYTQGMRQDQAFTQNQAAVGGANAQQNLGMMGSAAGQVGGLLAGMNEGSRASYQGKATNTFSDMVTELRQGKLDANADIRSAIRDTRLGRKDAIRSLLEQMAQTGWSQWMDLQNLRLNRKNSSNFSGGGGGGYTSSYTPYSYSSGGGDYSSRSYSSGSGGGSYSSGGGSGGSSGGGLSAAEQYAAGSLFGQSGKNRRR